MPKWAFLLRPVSVVLIVCLAVSTSAQNRPVSTKDIEAIRHRAETLAPNSPISVILFHGAEEFGQFVSCDAEGFTFRDIDRKVDVTLKYSEVRKLKNGYGGYNSVRGTHTDHTKSVVFAVVICGVLGALIGAAATAKN